MKIHCNYPIMWKSNSQKEVSIHTIFCMKILNSFGQLANFWNAVCRKRPNFNSRILFLHIYNEALNLTCLINQTFYRPITSLVYSIFHLYKDQPMVSLIYQTIHRPTIYKTTVYVNKLSACSIYQTLHRQALGLSDLQNYLQTKHRSLWSIKLFINQS